MILISQEFQDEGIPPYLYIKHSHDIRLLLISIISHLPANSTPTHWRLCQHGETTGPVLMGFTSCQLVSMIGWP